MTTERATSARAMEVTTFEAVPPGQQATRISPTASGGSRPSTVATDQPAAGMIRNCATNPVTMASGRVATRVKSPTDSVIPMPSMITARAATIALPRNQAKKLGSANASPHAASTQSGNALATSSRYRRIRGHASVRCG